jgi:hypothetical protein
VRRRAQPVTASHGRSTRATETGNLLRGAAFRRVC